MQLTLGLDRDSERIAHLAKHDNEAFRTTVGEAVRRYREMGVKVGFCGQQPSNHPEFSKFLVTQGIDSISVTPDSVLKTTISVANIGKSLAEEEP